MYFAVIATTATLIAVFIPVALLPGQTGQMFREFALVLAISVSISSFVALTLCPMMASRLLQRQDSHTGFLVTTGIKIRDWYLKSLTALLNKSWIGIAIMILILVAGYQGYRSLNQELLPQEDRGQLDIMLLGPDGASLAYIDRQVIAASKILAKYQKQGLIEDIHTIVGRYDKNKALISAQLTSWDQRSISQQELASEFSRALNGITGANIRIRQPSSLQQRGNNEGLEIAMIGQDYDEIFEAATLFSRRLQDSIPEIQDTRVQFDVSQPELRFEINRQAANDLNVPLERISQTLRIMVDELNLIDLSIDDFAVPVILASAGGSITNAQDLLNLFVTNSQGELIPLQSLVSIKEQGIAAQLDRYAQRRAIKINLGTTPQAPVGDIVNKIKQLALDELPANVNIEFLGEAGDLESANYELLITFAIAFMVVFLVLAAQFESFGLALIVISTVPFGLAVVTFVLIITGQTLNLYTQIGFIMLIGLMTKNAILLIEFMEQIRAEGQSVLASVTEGARVRFRPVMMTVLSTIFGALPLVLAYGPGAEARVAIGWMMVAGLGMATFITLYLAPLAYYWLAPLIQTRTAGEEKLLEQMKGN